MDTIECSKTRIYRVDVMQIIGLRYHVLREGMPIESASFDGDNVPSTRHFGVFLVDSPGKESNGVVCCASFMQNHLDGERAWQLRGMATDPGHRGKGFGRDLLAHAEQVIPAESGIHLFWCNARLAAVTFYEKMGWNVISDEVFELENAGPHRKMVREL